VFPPQEVEIWAGDNVRDMKRLKRLKPIQPTGYMPNGVEALPISLDAVGSYRYYRIVARPLAKLPTWHNSKGERGWLFVDEVFFY
jgi:hypothetical protein